MSSASAYPADTTLSPSEFSSSVSSGELSHLRRSGYLVLCRPRIAVMTAISVAVGFTLGTETFVEWSAMFSAIFGVVLFVAASSILNQTLERDTDSLMHRTLARPLVTGVIGVNEALIFGTLCALVGFVVLASRVNLLCAVASTATMVIYVACYTPLKRTSILCTTIGAIPGAMPPVLGWIASGASSAAPAFALFALFFVWQFPHFLAIAWIYRSQYARAGLKMLPGSADGRMAGMIALLYAVAFVPISILPRYVGLAGNGYLLSALVLSIGYLGLTIRFAGQRTDLRARQLMLGSLICLPSLLISLVVDFVRMTS